MSSICTNEIEIVGDHLELKAIKPFILTQDNEVDFNLIDELPEELVTRANNSLGFELQPRSGKKDKFYNNEAYANRIGKLLPSEFIDHYLSWRESNSKKPDYLMAFFSSKEDFLKKLAEHPDFSISQSIEKSLKRYMENTANIQQTTFVNQILFIIDYDFDDHLQAQFGTSKHTSWAKMHWGVSFNADDTCVYKDSPNELHLSFETSYMPPDAWMMEVIRKIHAMKLDSLNFQMKWGEPDSACGGRVIAHNPGKHHIDLHYFTNEELAEFLDLEPDYFSDIDDSDPMGIN